MGQFFKKVAVIGLLSASSCGVAQAQSPWRWPSQPPQPSAPAVVDDSLWERLSASTPANQALIGPSDFQFPKTAKDRGFNSLAAENNVITPRRVTGLSWDTLVGGEVPRLEYNEQAAAVAQQVNWDSIQAASPIRAVSPNVTASNESLDGNGNALAIAPATWQRQPETNTQGLTRSPYDVGMVGPMDQVAPTLMQNASVTTSAAKPISTDKLNTQTSNTEALAGQSPSKLIVADDFPQPGTEQVLPIPFPAASRNAVAPQVESPSEHSLISVSLLPMQAVGVAVVEPEPALPEVVSSTVVGQQQLVLQNVRGPTGSAQPETIVPIDIIPFSRLVRSKSQLEGVTRTYNAASMTGPLSDPASLFSKLHVEEDFRQQAFVPAGDVRLSTDPFSAGSEWMQQAYAWVTPTFYHRPLYFEQPNLERYGLGTKRWLQPVHSAAHFFGSIGTMPYKLITQHPGEHVYTLGNNRPGDCVPVQRRTLLGQSYPLEAMRYFDDHAGYK